MRFKHTINSTWRFISRHNLQKLFNSCPFLSGNILYTPCLPFIFYSKPYGGDHYNILKYT